MDNGAMLKALLSTTLLAVAAVSTLTAAEPEQDSRLYELRTYHAEPAKLYALLRRFHDHTLKLFEKHGMTNVGYWVPIENPDRLLVYLLAYPDMKARDESWKAFLSDPDWRKAAADSEIDGKLVGKVEQSFMKPTNFSMGFQPSADDGGDRVFEMRTYTATPGNLQGLHTRFRDHTQEFFKRHGMTNLCYFQPVPDQKDADTTLVYFLAHQDQAAAGKSWDAFRKDPEWVTAKKASETAARGPLTTEGGVVSVFMMPTDFSPVR